MAITTADTVAQYIIRIAHDNGDSGITNLKLQKLLYYAHAWHLVNFKKSLFIDNIEAWEFGPVIPSVYRKYKQYAHKPIPQPQSTIDKWPFSVEQEKFLKEFYLVFGGLTATALVSMTHLEKPWREAFSKGKFSVISNDTMKDFYTKLYERKIAEKRQKNA